MGGVLMDLMFGARMATIAAALNPFGPVAVPKIRYAAGYPVARSGNTGVPAARRRKHKQRGRSV